MFEFGAGTLWGFPVSGNTAPNPTPMKFGTLQDVSLDISGDVKQLYGQKQFPEAVARGKCKITGKSKFAAINGKMFNDLFFGQTMGAGMIKTSLDETGTVPATTPFNITVVNAATFKQDWGVRSTATGVPFTRVASGPVQGQYSVTTGGVYTFASADANAAVLISYTFTQAAPGTQLNITNQLMGFAPTIQVLLETVYNSNQFSVLLYSVVASKLSFTTKQEDFIIPEFDFEAFANAAGQVIDIYSNE
ncbi:MAG TPA: hypothetical protein VKL99_05695 [Candidatus Angelobacter sp.]|nr:hypothetical protein [Candidatus Angelobacter sp.]